MQIPGFKVVRLIAEGGMATVYLAIQESLGRFVALKLLKKFDNPEQSNRFLNEGRIIASLNHQNIITIHDIGVFGDQHYISMEYPEGGDLKARLKGGMPAHAALDLIEGIGSCLDFVHRKGIVHRDIKPGNILFRKDDTPVLTDFGIAKQLEQDTNLTMDGTAIGSPYYLSPEQAECKPLDGRTDIYGLGIVLFEMLMGRKPYKGKSYIEIVMAHKTEPIPSLSPHLQVYQGLLERMIAKDPKDRFRSAREMLKFLRKLDPIDTMEIAPRKGAGSIPGGQDTGAVERDVGTTMNANQPARPAGSSKAQKAGKDKGATPSRPESGSEPLSYRLRWPIMGMVTLLITGSIWTTYQFKDEPNPRSEARHAVKQPSGRFLKAPDNPMAPRASKQGKQPTAGIAAGARQQGTLASTPALSGSAGNTAASSPDVDPRKAAQLRRQRQIQGYLSKARQAMATSRLTMPERDSAFYYYQQVIDRSPKNKEALLGLKKIANRYAYLAEKEMDRRDREKAKRYILRGLKVQGNHPKLNDLDTRISQLEEKERKVAEYLSAANRSLNSSKLTKPPKDNAYHYYQKVLKLSPGNKSARRGITRVADRYADLAEKEIDQYRYAKAKEYVNLGLGVQPKHPRLIDLRTRTNAVEDVPRRFFGKIKSIFD